jgi:hypothetical protein
LSYYCTDNSSLYKHISLCCEQLLTAFEITKGDMRLVACNETVVTLNILYILQQLCGNIQGLFMLTFNYNDMSFLNIWSSSLLLGTTPPTKMSTDESYTKLFLGKGCKPSFNVWRFPRKFNSFTAAHSGGLLQDRNVPRSATEN